MFNNFNAIDGWEIMGDAIEEVADWEEFEADTAESDPWDDDLEMGFDPYAGCYDFDC